MLSTLNPHVRDANISFQEYGHIYTINGMKSYKSVTTWVKSHFSKFDSDAIINKMMNSPKWPNNKYFGKTKEDIKQEWKMNGDIAAKLGTEMHKMFEDYYNGNPVDETGLEYSYFQKFITDFPNLKSYRSEWMIYDEDLKLAGSMDMVFINDDGTLSIYDWKRCKSLEKATSFNQYAHEPISYMPDTNYWHYSLQLNTYKMILERKYGFIVKEMYLICIHPELDETYQKHEVFPMNMTALIEHNKKS